jgi:D-inositol-3-phosphate glycosyltransferase
MTEPHRAPHRPRLLVVGDGLAATGFGRVLHSILAHLEPHYDIHHIGIGYWGDPHDAPWKIYPAQLGGDVYGSGRLAPLIEQLKPDLIFLVNDIWVLSEHMARIKLVLQVPRAKVVAYCPIETGPVDKDLLGKIEGLDRFVVYTKFARDEVEVALTRLRQERSRFRFPAVQIIPHGVDTASFPAHAEDVGEISSDGRRRALRALYGEEAASRPWFIVLNANRNQPRKRIDTTIKGFARFAAGKPDHVKLHLHMGVEDDGWNVVTLAQRHGIADRLILTAHGPQLFAISIPAVPLGQLRDIYTAAVVGLNTSSSEGWGLVSFEHAATGAAQVVPRHTACADLWEGSAMMLEPVMSLTNPKILTESYLVSPEGVADALERLYADRDLLRVMSMAAYRLATRPELRWDNIARRWHALFEETLGTRC